MEHIQLTAKHKHRNKSKRRKPAEDQRLEKQCIHCIYHYGEGPKITNRF